jgi:hypothetical protein
LVNPNKIKTLQHLSSVMVTCELCSKSGDELSLREASHKEMGKKWVCGECWTNLYMKNDMVTGTTGGGGPVGCAGGCRGCRHA